MKGYNSGIFSSLISWSVHGLSVRVLMLTRHCFKILAVAAQSHLGGLMPLVWFLISSSRLINCNSWVYEKFDDNSWVPELMLINVSAGIESQGCSLLGL